jgi:16S rRNA (cytidine1402-2'-O)-methyltransferase
LSVTKKSRFEHLNDVKNDRRTLVFYEAPHKLLNTLKDMLDVFGDRRISLVREITKLHEQVIRTTLSGAIQLYTEKSPKGEFVLVIEGAKEQEKASYTLDEAQALVKKLVDEGKSLSQAAKEAAAVTGFKKGDLYKSQIV